MRDAIAIEQLGTPAVAVMTEPFVPTALALAAMLGLPDYPLAVIPHPISSDTPEALRRKAATAVAQAVAILAGHRPD